MFICIVAFVGNGFIVHVGRPNMKGFNFKLYLSRF